MLELEISRSWRSLTVVVCKMPLIPTMIIMVVVLSTLVRIGVGGECIFIKILVCGFYGESIIIVSEIQIFAL